MCLQAAGVNRFSAAAEAGLVGELNRSKLR